MAFRHQWFLVALACLFLAACGRKPGDVALAKMQGHVDNLKHLSDAIMKNVREVRFDVTETKSLTAPFEGFVEWDCDLVGAGMSQACHYTVRAKFRDEAWFVETVGFEIRNTIIAVENSAEPEGRKRSASILKMRTD